MRALCLAMVLPGMVLLAGLPPAHADPLMSRNRAELLGAIHGSVNQGLDPDDYAAAVDAPVSAAPALDGAVFEALTPGEQNSRIRAAAVHLARDIVFGRHPAPDGSLETDPDPAATIDRALAAGTLGLTLRGLQPAAADYDILVNRLRDLLAARATPSADERPDAAAAREQAALRATLERWRQLPRALPSSMLLVDIPWFDVALIRDGVVEARHDVIVGMPEHPTPTFRATVRGVIYDPVWKPPIRLVRESVIPAIRAGRGAALGYQLYRNGVMVPLNSLRWRGRTALPAGYEIVQKAGVRNALGAVKLDMPNPYSVYLHDTPNKELFGKPVRALSNGCVRVRDALGLADRLLADTPRAGAKTVPLPVSLPLFVVYMTARPGPQGVTIAPDIYNLDAALDARLARPHDETGGDDQKTGECIG